MKPLLKIVYILVFTAILPVFFQSFADNGASSAEQYNRAGSLYRDGHFGEALSIYEKLIRDGITNPDLFYNASNAVCRTGSIGKAILYLERALKLAPSDKEVLANRAYLNSIKEDQEPEESNIVLAVLARRYTTITVNSAAIWSVFMFALAMALAMGALFLNRWKKGVFVAASILCGLIFVFSTGIFIQKVHHGSTVVEGIIIAKEGMSFNLGGMEIEVFETPGHALHHLSFFDRKEGRLFAGEAAGIYVGKVDLSRPATPLPFNLEVSLISLDKLINLNPKSLCYSHFGCVGQPLDKMRYCREQLILWGHIIADCVERGANPQDMYDEICEKDSVLARIGNLSPDERDTQLFFASKCVAGYIGYFERYGTGYLKQL